ncbi:MAG: UvrD-helicase domain-containing protein [Bacteroidales bacterium]
MLTVYRASAGSGKTYLLTGTFLRMLFTENTTFDNILAVTFTNKATDEMKQRIIEQLHLLSVQPEKSGYLKMLTEQFGISTAQVRAKARKVLISILHDFSGFNVSTIDRFFQQTTRSFTREIGLQGGYEVELDTDKVRNEAIDRMIAGLANPENKKTLDWLLLFSNDRTESGKDWNTRKELLSLSREILKEDYKKNSEKILAFTENKENLEDFIKEIKVLMNDFEEASKEIGTSALEIMKANDLTPTDFTGGSRSQFKYFELWAKGEIKPPTPSFLKLEEGVENWSAKTTPAGKKMMIQGAFDAGLKECVEQVIYLYGNLSRIYDSAKATLRYIYTVGILSDIDRNMRDYSRENNIMLITDTTELLHKVIDGKDTPFVYEKIGTRIKHFMIDEFQDTSGMQWDNFKPLISDSIAQDFSNLIVGDVKQSIYRWRNSDWMLLHDGIRRYEPEQREDCVLDTNWRSCKNIVDFNNTFFTMAANMLQDKYNAAVDKAETSARIGEEYRSMISSAYTDIYQKVPKEKQDQAGHVRVEFIDNEKEESWREEVLNRLPDTLIELQKQGYPLKDIAILVRTGREGAVIADTLLTYKAEHPESPYRFDVISNEALFISQAPVIRMIISFMNYLNNPSSDINKVIAAYNLFMNVEGSSAEKALADYFYDEPQAHAYFNKMIIEESESLRKLPLFEMSEKIIDLVIRRDNPSDKVYVQAFQDLVVDFTTSNTADLSAFLTWWEATGERKTISTPDSQDAIRILTIHKSKGLGFKAVIVPFAAWDIDHEAIKENIIWCEPTLEPFNKLPMIPVRYGSSLLNTIYAENYLTEMRQAFIDNLNIAYVAFTRAKEELIVFAPKEKKPEDLKHIGSVLYSAMEWSRLPVDDREYLNLSELFDPEEQCFEAGNWWNAGVEKEKGIEEISMGRYISIDPGSRLQLRLHGKGYFQDKEERLYGNLMHEILSAIKYPEDIEGAVREFVRKGSFREEEAPEIINRIKSLVNAPAVHAWFAPEANVFNETEILIADGTFLRPDRVVMIDDTVIVIDYKFGKKEQKSYIRQVTGYMQQLYAMGYEKVEGYLWYVELDKTVRIESPQLSLF